MRTLKTLAASAVLAVAGAATTAAAPGLHTPAAAHAGPAFSPADVIDLLTAGNLRFAQGRPEHRNAGIDRVAITADTARPFAAVLACSDARLPIGRLFDRGVGDLFTIRVAGNLIGSDTAGSIEHAVDSFSTPVVVVLGHGDCAAIRAAQSGPDAAAGENARRLFSRLAPAIERARSASPPGVDPAAAAVRANVFAQVEALISTSPIVASAIASGRLAVTAAIYDVKTGRVDWLGEHPRQASLVAAAGTPFTRAAIAETPTATPAAEAPAAPALAPLVSAAPPAERKAAPAPTALRRRFVNVPTQD